jgi:hypothetical protein
VLFKKVTSMTKPDLKDYFLSNATSMSSKHLMWKTISELEDVFLKTNHTKALMEMSPVDNFVENPQNAVAALDAGDLWPKFFFPIRFFRSQTTADQKIVSHLRFMSSGTTSGDDGRSVSTFSEVGAELYKLASLKTFASVLESTLGPYAHQISGISLIPKPADWPDSSLAKMLEWIGEVWSLEYVDHQVPDHLDQAIKRAPGPVFVFGTAFHFVDLLDSGRMFELPKASLLIETGGTKGKSRRVTRSELYDLMCRNFQCGPHQIISEYGMCELASQAYDFVPFGKNIDLSERKFRFPSWVKTKVMTKPALANSEGVGALLVWDQARSDISYPIQTEDLGHVFEDGSFKLLGRVPSSPLKGCSLKVEDAAKKLVPTTTRGERAPISERTRRDIEPSLTKNSNAAHLWLAEVVRDQEFKKLLASELASEALCKLAISDLAETLPTSSELAKTALLALGKRTSLPLEWLVIPPSNHSVAALQVLAVAFTVGLTIDVRLSKILGQNPDAPSALSRALDLAKKQGLIREILPNTWRLSANHFETRSLITFGDNSTVAALSRFTSGEAIGCGNKLAATISTADDLKDAEVIRSIIKDNLSLSQRGCRSARVNFVLGSLGARQRRIINESSKDMLPDLTFTDQTSWDGANAATAIEAVRLTQLGAEVIDNGSTQIAYFTKPVNWSKALSKLGLTIIFIELPKETAFSELLATLPKDLNLLSIGNLARLHFGIAQNLSTFPHYIEHVSPGMLNRPDISSINSSGAFFAQAPAVELK